MLSGIRALELSAPSTMLAGQILADLGADVIVIEPPAGAAGRRMPPFLDEQPGLERSLVWHALNRNKRSVTLDMNSTDGSALALDLFGSADVVISDSRDSQAFNPAALRDDAVNLVINTFAAGGPKAAYKASDVVLMAAGGSPCLSGDAARAPLFFPTPQAIMEAGTDAAVAALTALVGRDFGAPVQTVRLDNRISAIAPSLGRIVAGRSGDKSPTRLAPMGIGGTPLVRSMYATLEGGYVILVIPFSPAMHRVLKTIADWLREESALDSETAERDWLAITTAAREGKDVGDEIRCLENAVASVCARKSSTEILEMANDRHFIAAPVMSMANIAAFDHYRQRGLFSKQAVGDKFIEVPARFAQFSNYSIEVYRPAPSLSEHTLEIFAMTSGLTLVELGALFAQGVC